MFISEWLTGERFRRSRVVSCKSASQFVHLFHHEMPTKITNLTVEVTITMNSFQPRKLSISTRDVLLFVYPFDENSKDRIPVYRHDILTVYNSKPLNDVIISLFLQFYFKDATESVKESIHVFNSFFFSKIKSIYDSKSSSFEKASRWIKDVKIFEKDFLIMPVCEKEHWILVIVCYPGCIENHESSSISESQEFRKTAVIVLNSYFGYAPSIKRVLGDFLAYQWEVDRGEQRSFRIGSKCKVPLIFPTVPQQKNDYNCGVFVLSYFRCFIKNPRENYMRMIKGKDLEDWFSENDLQMHMHRRKMKTTIASLEKEWIQYSSDNNISMIPEETVSSRGHECVGEFLQIDKNECNVTVIDID